MTMTRLWQTAAVAALAGTAAAGDLTTGYNFSSGEQNITHTKLNNAVNQAVINPSFFTGKSATTAPVGTDIFLLSRAGAFYQVTLANLLLNNRAVVTNPAPDTLPAPGDFVLTYDVSDGLLKKATLNDLVFTNAALLSDRAVNGAPGAGAWFLTLDGPNYGRVPRTNLWNDAWRYPQLNFTNLTEHLAPTNLDQLVVFSREAGSNRTSTLIGLLTNLPASATPAVTDTLLLAQTGEVRQVTIGALSNLVRQAASYALFSSTNAVFPAAGDTLAIPHGLAGAPQEVRAVAVCVANDAATGYLTTDGELDLVGVAVSSVGQPAFTVRANGTNVTVLRNSTSAFVLMRKSDGAWTSASSSANFRLKIYATYHP